MNAVRDDPPRPHNYPATSLQAPETRLQQTALAVVVLMQSGILLAGLQYPVRIQRPVRTNDLLAEQVATRLDVNTARWFELAQLSRIGETTARSIVAFREQRRRLRGHGGPVFHGPADLTQVKGIGDKTVRRIRPFVRFAP